MSTNQSPIHWLWKSSIICLLITSWKLLSESNNKQYIGQAYLHTVGVTCLTSFRTAVTIRERTWRENVQQVSGDLSRSANPCNRTTVFSLSWRAQHMNGHANPCINIGVDRLPSKLLGQMHYISCLIENTPAPPSPSFVFKLDMLCWKSVFLRREMMAVDLFQSQLIEQSC